MRTMNKSIAVRPVLAPAAYAAAAQAGAWIPMRGFRRCQFIVELGATTGAVDVKVQKATDGSGTGATDVTGLAAAFTASDDGKLGLIEVRDADLGSGFTHLTVVVTPAAAGTYLAASALLSQAYSEPVANAAANGVVFNVGE